jgi:hypothetical protein
MEPYMWYPQRAGRVDLILERATGKINDPVLRQEIAKVLAMAKAAEWIAAPRPHGAGAGATARSRGLSRQAGVQHHRPHGGSRAYIIAGTGCAADRRRQPNDWVAGGDTAVGAGQPRRRWYRRDSAQHISEHVLKMPRKRTGDTDKPFKDVPRNIVA